MQVSSNRRSEDRVRIVYVVIDGLGQYVTQDKRGRTNSLIDAGTWKSRVSLLAQIDPDEVDVHFYVPAGDPVRGWAVFEVEETINRTAIRTS